MIESMDRMFLPVGQGAFYCERFYSTEQDRNLNVVYDCGTLSKQTGKTSLELIKDVADSNFDDAKNKIIDAVFISHLHEDHFNGLEYLVRKCKIRRIYLPHMEQLELRLMQLYYVAHHTSSGNENDSLGEHFLNCNDLETDFREALQNVMQAGDKGVNDHNDGDVPEVMIVGPESNIVSQTIFEGNELNGNFSNWKYKTFCIKNDRAIQRVKDGLRQLTHEKLQTDVTEISSGHVADLIRKCRADKMFRREISNAFKSAVNDFHANSLLLYSGCDNTAELYAYSGVRSCGFKRNGACKFLEKTDKTYLPKCWMFTNAVGCLYTGDFTANQYWDQLESGFENEWETIGCIQIPHHGSKHNYDKRFLEMSPWHVVSAGKCSKYHHPHKEVRAKYNCRCPLIVVTEDMNSLAKWCVEEKSSIHVAEMNADLGLAVKMEWHKKSGTSVLKK